MARKDKDIEMLIEQDEEIELPEGTEEDGEKKKRGSLLPWVLSLVLPCYALDQLAKWYICKSIALHTGFTVIPGFFDIFHVRNTGAAFGMLQGIPDPIRTYFFLGITIVAFIAMFVVFSKVKEKSWAIKLIFSLIAAGAIGNLTDRFLYSEVVDFLSFHIGSFRWPTFNLADVYISLGMIGLLVTIFLTPKEQRE